MVFFYFFINEYLLNSYFVLSVVLSIGDVVFKLSRYIFSFCEVYSLGRGYIFIYLYLSIFIYII